MADGLVTPEPSWLALDFAHAVLAGDPVARDRALERLLETPREGLLAMGTLLLLVAGPESRQQLEHMLAMTTLREVGQ